MRIVTPSEVATQTQNKYLGVLVAAKFAKFVNEFPRDRSVDLEQKLTTRALDELVRARLKYRSEEHTSELQSRLHLVCRLLLEKKKKHNTSRHTTTAPTIPSPSTKETQNHRATQAMTSHHTARVHPPSHSPSTRSLPGLPVLPV